MSDRVPGKALVFTYRTLSRFFHAVSDRVFAGPSTFCCALGGREPVNLMTSFYKHYREQPVNYDLTDQEFFEIIVREGILRLLPLEQSWRIVNAMYRTIDELTDTVRPDYLLTVMVDNHMTDLLARICRKKGIKVVMLATGSLDNTIIVTRYGEFNKVREPDEEEITNGMARLLDDTGRVTYGNRVGGYSAWRHLRMHATWWAKRAYFKIRSLLRNDPLDHRYLMSTLPAFDGRSSIWGYRATHYFDHDWEARLQRATLPALFVPLAYYPEASVTYWLRDLRYMDYDNFIIDAARHLSRSYQVLIKEHWSMLGLRRWSFHRRLKSIPGVTLVPAEVNSRKVMAHVERVLVGAGTTGVEAAVRGKRVATLDKPYYFVEGSYLNVGSAERLKDLPDLLEEFQPPATVEARRNLVRRMLQATLIGHFLPDPYLNSEENYATFTASLKQYLSLEACGASCHASPQTIGSE